MESWRWKKNEEQRNWQIRSQVYLSIDHINNNIKVLPSVFLFDRSRVHENYGIYVKAAQSYWLSSEFGKLDIPSCNFKDRSKKKNRNHV